MNSHVAPKAMSYRRAEVWAKRNNPNPPGSAPYYGWMIAFWRDQSDRSGRLAHRLLTVSLVFLTLSIVLQVVVLVMRSFA